MALIAGCTRPYKRGAIEVPEFMRLKVRQLICQLGRQKTVDILHVSVDVFEELRGECGILRPDTLDRVRARLEEIAGNEKLLTG